MSYSDLELHLKFSLTSFVNQVPHFNVIIHGKVRDCMGIFPTSFAEFTQNFIQVASVFVEELRQNRAILETSVHSLSIEGYNCMASIANEKNLRRNVIRIAFDRYQMLRLDFKEVFDQSLFSDQWNCISKENTEETQKILGSLKLSKVLEWHEKRNCPCFVLVGKCNHHKFTTWPDVKIVVWHFKLK